MTFSLPFRFTDEAARRGDPAAQALLTPRRATADAAGFDLVAALEQPLTLVPGARALLPTGVAVAIPPGFEGSVRPRSGLALRHGVTCLNAPGTIDADYRGEIGVILVNLGEAPVTIERGMRIAQLLIQPVVAPDWQLVEALPPSPRDAAGFGSTGGMGPPKRPDGALASGQTQPNRDKSGQ